MGGSTGGLLGADKVSSISRSKYWLQSWVLWVEIYQTLHLGFLYFWGIIILQQKVL